MVAVAHIAHARFEGAEVPENIRATEFVIKGSRSDRAFGHHRQGRGNARGCSVHIGGLIVFFLRRVAVVFPILRVTGNMQRRDRKAAKAGLRTCAAACGTLITDFSARTCGSTREGTDGRRVVVGFDFKDRVGGLEALDVGRAEQIPFIRTRIKARNSRTFQNCGIVRVRHNRSLRRGFVRLANHLKERFGLLDAVNRKFGIKNLMAAVLGISLRKHHQFHIRGVAFLSGKGIY